MDDIRNQMRDMGRQFGETMRAQAHERARQRKAEYLGARVPVALKEKVIARAEALGIPASDLIRDVLEQAFSSLPEVTHTSPSTADMTATDTSNSVDFTGIIGWETITLNQNMACRSCGSVLASGQEVTLGLALSGNDHAILCRKCRPLINS